MTDRQRRLHYARRKVKWAGIIVTVFAAVIIADRLGVFGSRAPTDSEKYGGKMFRVTRVVDGDTLDVDIADDRTGYPSTRVRLLGVDTPETLKPDTPPQHFGPEASTFTKTISLNKIVRIEVNPSRTRDKYDRLLAYVYLPDARMLNRLLIAEGYAYADPRFEHKFRNEFRRLQRKSRKGAIGLWKDVRRIDLPYYYRNLKLTASRRPQ